MDTKIAAKSIGGDYASGYQQGLRRFYHGESLGTVTEHDKWLHLDGQRQELGDGYRDGFTGKPPRGMSAMLGNKNAQNDLPADCHIHIRINCQLKSLYVKQAQKEGMKLSAWMIKTLTAGCKNPPL